MATVVYIVQKGDTLSEIASKFKKDYGTTTSILADLNKITNINKITVGQKLIIWSDEVSSPTSSTTEKVTGKKALITKLDIQDKTDRTVFATWAYDKKNIDYYKIKWTYSTGDGVAFIGDESDTEHKQSIYNAPSNARLVKFKVKPVAKKRKVNGKKTAYWTAEWSEEKQYSFSDNPPITPSAPNVEMIDGVTIKATLTGLKNINATHIEFQIAKNDTVVSSYYSVAITTESASYQTAVPPGGEYKVRARSVDGADKSEWSEYSSIVSSKPIAPSGIMNLEALSETSVLVTWTPVVKADQYTIEYTSKKEYFDTNQSEVKSTTDTYESGQARITGIETGQEYFFRLCAVKGNEKSAWTAIKSIRLGEKPSAPTTWSSTTTGTNKEDLILYWVHNTVDGSAQEEAELTISVSGFNSIYKSPYTLEGSGRFKIDSNGELFVVQEFTDDDKFNTNSCIIDTSKFVEGVKIEWSVRTKGIVNEYGDASVSRTVDIYAQPVLSLELTDSSAIERTIFESFPIMVKAMPWPESQTPIGYHLSVVSNETYETIDNVGNAKIVSAGEEVYSKYFDIKNVLIAELSANNINLENNVSYILKCVVSMDSGLTAEDEKLFGVVWEDSFIDPNAEIAIDKESLTANIRPFYESERYICYEVAFDSETGFYVETGETVADMEGEILEDAYTVNGDVVYTNKDGILFYISEDTETTLIDGIKLSVYRREYDGRFVEIATGINNVDNTFVTDPHPALDFARYRVVATTEATGAISYIDIPGEPIEETSVVIQWDEEWTPYQTFNEDALQELSWTGSMLKLPYNIDVSDSNKADVSLINYVGRSHPVSYYGTHVGTTSTWNVEIPKSDKETLYALRKLAIWMGDVYVREPSGSGYWANISISFSQKHCAVTIPVTLSITRVEGGI